jgi:hypothetical protein
MTAASDPKGDAPPTVVAVGAFEALPLGARGSRRALVRWSDGTEGEALRWYHDEIRVTEDDLIGRTADEIKRLHFRRDRAFLRSPDPSGG